MLSIIISTWNCLSQIEKCLESLEVQDYRDFEVVCIDQNSTDGTWEYLQRSRFTYPLRHCKATMPTWTMANELGIKMAHGDWLGISNPDIIFPPASLRMLASSFNSYIVEHPIIGCKLVSPIGQEGHPMKRLDTASIFFVASHRTLGTWLDRKLFHRFFQKRFIASNSSTGYVQHLQMSFFLIHRDTVEKTGLWDSRYRWAVADSDLLRKAEAKGVKQLYLHSIQLIHEGEFSRRTSSKALYDYEYAYGYKLYSSIWKLYGLPFLFLLDTLVAPLLAVAAGEDNIRSQIHCSAAKIKGLLT